ncbi:MAG: DNA alkylation repair enzyme [Methanoregulaceae archaeon PtaB.Bin056]|jgi:3-methyladenine DNA glycosylase AlkD|nr:MAG: DNA alkylation repair enzyme [Methanoregulaceae archaeon PtaB.Bin056]
MDPLIARIRKELSEHADPEIQKNSKRFFKEEIRCYGIKTARVVAIAKQYWKEIKSREKGEILALCEELYKSGYMEESFIASEWTQRLSDDFEREDLSVFRRWIGAYISNWASCDGFCNHTMGAFFEKYPDTIDELKRWTQSENRWMRRAAAVSLIIPAKRGKFLEESLAIADLLLTDEDDLVQKGYGWLLKEASRMHSGEVFSFVMEKKRDMPRTALRYAIELMPKELKNEAMKKDWERAGNRGAAD